MYIGYLQNASSKHKDGSQSADPSKNTDRYNASCRLMEASRRTPAKGTEFVNLSLNIAQGPLNHHHHHPPALMSSTQTYKIETSTQIYKIETRKVTTTLREGPSAPHPSHCLRLHGQNLCSRVRPPAALGVAGVTQRH